MKVSIMNCFWNSKDLRLYSFFLYKSKVDVFFFKQQVSICFLLPNDHGLFFNCPMTFWPLWKKVRTGPSRSYIIRLFQTWLRFFFEMAKKFSVSWKTGLMFLLFRLKSAASLMKNGIVLWIIFQGVDEDLQSASKKLISAIKIRERYETISQQSFPNTVAVFIHNAHGSRSASRIIF